MAAVAAVAAARGNKSSSNNKRKTADRTSDKGKSFDKNKTFKKSHNDSKASSNKNVADPNLSSSAQRRAVKQERQSHRRHADVVKDAKDLWNKLRLKTNTKEDIVPLMEKLMVLLYHTDTTLYEIALQHDASRVVQAAIQFANDAQRRKLCRSLQVHIPEMSKIQYAHFCVLKLLQYAHRDVECIQIIVKAFKGHLCKLAVHSVGARVVELLFTNLPAKHTNALKQEFYGPHFYLFADTADLLQTTTSTTTPTTPTTTGKSVSLQYNIQLHPDKKDIACDYLLTNVIQKGLDKGLYGFAYFQQLLCEYVTVVGHDRDLITSLVDHSLHMLSTRPGTQVVLYCIAYGTAKDRKRILKVLKGYSRSSLLHRDAYLAILQIVLVTDDTVSVHKSLLSELLTVDPEKQKNMDEKDQQTNHPLLDIALHDQASKLFLLLLDSHDDAHDNNPVAGSTNKFLDPLEQTLLQRNPMVMEQGVQVSTCKKNHHTRRKELLQYILKPLDELCLQHANQLARSVAGSRVLQCMCTHAPSHDLNEKLVQLCGNTESNQNEDITLLDDPIGHLLIKHLAMAKDHDFAHVLATKLDFQRITSSRAAFVVAALLVSPKRTTVLDRISKMDLNKVIQSRLPNKNRETASNRTTTVEQHCAGFEALLKALNEKA